MKLIDNDLNQKEVQNRVNFWFLPKLQIWMIHHADQLDAFNFSIRVAFLEKKIFGGGTRLKSKWSSPRSIPLGSVRNKQTLERTLDTSFLSCTACFCYGEKLRSNGLSIQDFIKLRNQMNIISKCNILHFIYSRIGCSQI